MEDGTVVELSELEQDMFFSLLILAGNETTRNAISGGLVAFLEHRDQWQLLGEHPSSSTPRSTRSSGTPAR
jgi:cholest-4-en-3-one 26-monooxygenase